MSKIETSDAIVLVLHSPREKFWGVLHDINAAGVNVRGIDLNAFDDFAAQQTLATKTLVL